MAVSTLIHSLPLSTFNLFNTFSFLPISIGEYNIRIASFNLALNIPYHPSILSTVATIVGTVLQHPTSLEMNQNQSQHPDWAAIRDGYRLLSDNMHLLENVQPLNQANLLNELQAFRTEVRADMAGLRDEMAGLRDGMAGIRGDITDIQRVIEAEYGIYSSRKYIVVLIRHVNYSRFNAFARTQNASALVPNALIICLRDVRTNAVIPNFPQTTGGIDDLSGTDALCYAR